MVEQVIDGRKLVIRVRVAVERPSSRDQSYIRYGKGIIENSVSSGAWSGARFARHKVDSNFYRIEIQEISGDIDSPRAPQGAAVASAIATWIAYGADWTVHDLGDAYGWSLRRDRN